MDEAEARAIVDRRVAQLREQSYEELKDTWLHHADSEDHTGADGTWYQLEITAIWDKAWWDRRNKAGHLAVVVSIDAEGWHGIDEMFVIAPDGSFVGE
jgi:hypothetical protein